MNLGLLISGLTKSWVAFVVVVVVAGIGGGAYAAWTASLHVEGTVQTGDVDVVWDTQEDREFVGILDPDTGQLVNQPVPTEKDVSDCESSLEPGTTDKTVSFRINNAYPSYTCEITLGALVTGIVPVHVSDIQQEFIDAAGNVVPESEIEFNIDLLWKFEVGNGEFRCDPEQPIDIGVQLHEGDRFCAIITMHATEEAPESQSYTGSLWIDVIQWNFSEDVVLPPNNPPTPVDDTFDALGNTELLVGLTPSGTPATQISGSVLDNDSDPDGNPIEVIPGVSTTANGGSVNVNFLGQFSYSPPIGFNGNDNFTYTLDDGNGGTANGLVTLVVTDMVWYVDSGATAGGDGSSGRPFNTLAPLTTGGTADALDGSNDTIFVHQGTGDTLGGIVLEAGQSLIGQGIDLSMPSFSPDPLVLATGEPTILASTGTGVELASGNTVRGLNVRSLSGAGIEGTGVGLLTINSVPLVDSNNGPAVNIVGATAAVTIDRVVATNGSGDGIDLSNNTGAFMFAELVISNTNGTGLSAFNTGTLRVGGGANPSSINTTNGVGLNIVNTTIDAAGLEFQSISSSSAVNGIVLNNTGSSGGLSVTGNVAANSGGTIQSTTGDAISLVATNLVSLSLMSIGPVSGGGIIGDTVSNFSATDLALNNIGNANNEHGISFDELLGSNLITGTSITNAADHNVRVANTSGTMASLVITDSVFTSFGASNGGSGVLVELSNTAEITNLHIGGSTPGTDDANGTQFLDMDGFGIALLGSSTGGRFANVVIDDVHVRSANGGGVVLNPDGPNGGNGGGTFSLTNSEIEADNATAIGIGADGYANATVTVRNNIARVINRSFLGVSVVGIRADGNFAGDNPELHVRIDSNSISGGDEFGINAASRGSNGSLDARIVNNLIFDVGSDGVRIRAGNGSPGEADTVSVFLEGNDASAADVLGDGFDLRDQSNTTTFRIGCDSAAHAAECSAAAASAADDQGLLAVHNNLGTTAFFGITDTPPVFEVIDGTAVIAP